VRSQFDGQMDRFVSQYAGGSSVRGLAERLLANAAVNPELIRRCHVAIKAHDVQPMHSPRLALLSNPTLDVRPYLEDLVSVAVDAAERAETLSAQARQASRRTRRETLVVGCVGALGLLIGVIGFAARSSSDAKLVQISEQIALAQDQLRQAQLQIAAFQAPAMSPQPVQSIAASSIGPSPPAFRPPAIRYYTQPWPDSSLNSTNTRQVAATRNPQSTSQHFFSGIEREIHAIFR
jgi:hypothetical protein